MYLRLFHTGGFPLRDIRVRCESTRNKNISWKKFNGARINFTKKGASGV